MSPFSQKKGFTLIELMVVITIVAILVSISIPMMRLHYQKAKLTELTNSMSATASAVAAYYQDQYKFPGAMNTVAQLSSSLGVSIPDAANSRISAVAVAANTGVITFAIQNIDAMVNGSSLILIPSTTNEGSIVWTWSGSAGFPSDLIPKK